jgi:hypothetical protein
MLIFGWNYIGGAGNFLFYLQNRWVGNAACVGSECPAKKGGCLISTQCMYMSVVAIVIKLIF